MKIKPSAWLLGLGALVSSGCEIYGIAARNLAYEVCYHINRAESHFDNRHLAQKAWEHLPKIPGHHYSDDLVEGFVDGFADYLTANGTVNSHPLPPERYWCNRYKTPQGHQAIEEWFEGYRLGVETAIASGRRPFVTVPTAAPAAANVAGRANPVAGTPTPEADETTLPPPRPLTTSPAATELPPEPLPIAPTPEDKAGSSGALVPLPVPPEPVLAPSAVQGVQPTLGIISFPGQKPQRGEHSPPQPEGHLGIISFPTNEPPQPDLWHPATVRWY